MANAGFKQTFSGSRTVTHIWGDGTPIGPRTEFNSFQTVVPACLDNLVCSPPSSLKLARCFISTQEVPRHSEQSPETALLLGVMCQSAVTYTSTIASQLVIELLFSKEAHQQASVCTVLGILSSQITFCHYL